MAVMDSIIQKAKANKKRIVLPEGSEARTLKAAERVIKEGIADVVL
ncbi:MAG TPA: phosphate acetyltransferase, partial [Thermoanaerobacter sp.]|nr:phosphate acetyltransferase [Thermoanaerobacter sp.]